ncbi:hypothetical protein SteCoe_20955 [Stentor coeruleus]|uniref:Ion transport domain-containing protein n=1 Tax=Stentor coeruleus TaxID=5963 RepID=A0A1R2BQV2_9CILI|nr:hypothetical protein SteCoe_20955 [Stentor coeruleus]
MSENGLKSLGTFLLQRDKVPKVQEDIASNLDELFSNPGCLSYVAELKKAILHIERLSPKEITTPFKGNCLEISESGKYFIFGSIEGRIAVVDKDNKEIIQDIFLEGGSVYSIAIYKGDKYFVSAGRDGIIRKFDFKTFEPVQSFVGHEKEINKLAISADEEEIFSASDDCTVRSWDKAGNNKILYSHEKAVLSMDRSKDGSILVSGGSDKKVKFFNLIKGEVVTVLNEFTSSVWAVKISDNLKFFAAGDSNAVLKVWDYESMTLVKTLDGHTKRISHLEFNHIETILVSSSNDSTIRIWSVIEDKDEIILTGHTDWVKAFKISTDQKSIYSIAENYKIMTWHFPVFDNSCRKKQHSAIIRFMCYSRTQNALYTADSKEIKVWDIKTRSVTKTFNLTHELSALCVNSDGQSLIAAYTNLEIHFWNVDDVVSQVKLKHPSVVKIIAASQDHSLLVVGDANFRVTIYNKKTFDCLQVYRRHNSVVNALSFGKPDDGENKMLISGGADNLIFIYRLRTNRSVKFAGHTAPVTAVGVSRNNDLLISGDESGSFKIWHIRKEVCIKTLYNHTERITGIYFNENSKYFWISSMDCSLSLWNSTSFAEVTHFCSKASISMLCFTQGEKDIITVENDELHFLPTILGGNKFAIYGPGREYYSFMKYLLHICEGNELPHDPTMDKWMIAPFEFNALHFYAYFNLPVHLKQALDCNSPFYFSKSAYSPLQIAIQRNFRDCINVIMKNIRIKVQEDPYSVGYLEDSIIKLNEIGFRGLDEFYNAIFFSTYDKLLPKFCDERVKLPIVIQARSLGPQAKDFFNEEDITNVGTALTFIQSALKVDVIIGSRGSISFLESLVCSPNTEIFKTQFIRELVLYKWKYVKWFLIPQACLYCIYMLVLSYFLIFQDGEYNTTTVTILFILNVMLTSYELFQMALTRSMYLQDVWNYIDMARIILCFLYIALVWDNYDESICKQVLVSVTFASMLRGISYFRLFDDTRYMINLLSEVFNDMISFLILLTYSTYSFALIYFIMVNNLGTPQTFSYYVSQAYLLNLGDFSVDGYGAFEWLIFFFASVINPLIMLNLLISIMGDTYSRVKTEQEIADMKELTEMVIEGEYLLFCRRSQGKKTYLQICQEEAVTNPIAGPDEKITKIKTRVKNIQELMNNTFDESKNELRDAVEGLNSKMDEMTTLIEQISLTQE